MQVCILATGGASHQEEHLPPIHVNQEVIKYMTYGYSKNMHYDIVKVDLAFK